MDNLNGKNAETNDTAIRIKEEEEEFIVVVMDESEQIESDDKKQQNTKPIAKSACRFCGTQFKYRNSRTRHEKTCSLNREDRKFFQCESCSTAFTRECNLKLHKCDPTRNIRSCLIENCGMKFMRKKQLIEHLRTAHVSETLKISETVFHEFSDPAEFQKWKEEEEERTFSYFSQQAGKSRNGVVRYYCQKDGQKKRYAKKTDRRNAKGNVKTGATCIAQMRVSSKEGRVKVEYLPTHNHPCLPSDYVHHPLSTSTNAYVAQQLAWGVSPSKIHRRVVNSEKNATLTVKRIQARARKLKKDGCRPSDSSSGTSKKRKTNKLPVSQVRFGGELEDWLPFWSQFSKCDEDDAIDDEDKLDYLTKCMVEGSPARALVDSYPASEKTYSAVVSALKDKYAREDALTEFYIRELLQLVIQNSGSHEKLPLADLYDRLQSHLRNLDVLGVTREKCAAILMPMVSSCLPEDLYNAWDTNCAPEVRSANPNATSKDFLDSLIMYIHSEVEGDTDSGARTKNKPRKRKKGSDSSEVTMAADLLTGDGICWY